MPARLGAAQWHADRAARRPQSGKLTVNLALREYVEERLADLTGLPMLRASHLKVKWCYGRKTNSCSPAEPTLVAEIGPSN